MYFFRSKEDARRPRCRIDRGVQPPRQVLVTIVGLMGLLWLGAYPALCVLYEAFGVGPWTLALQAALPTMFGLLSYHLLRLREWARQLLLVLNGLCLFALWLYEFGMFVLLPWIINRSSSERILTLTSMQQKLAERAPSWGPIELIALHVYLLGSVYVLCRRHTQQMFWTHQQNETSTCSPRTKLALACVGLLLATQLTQFVTTNLPLVRNSATALKIHAIPLENSPQEDPLSCALFVVQQAQTADSLQRVGLLDSLTKAFSERGAVNQVVHIAEAVENANQASRFAHAAIAFAERDRAKADSLLARAYALAHKESSPLSRDRQLATVAAGYQKLGETNRALEIVDVITSPDEKARALCNIGASELSADHQDGGLQLLDLALSEALQAEGDKNRDDVLTRLAQLYYTEDTQKSERVIDLIQSPSAKALALCHRAAARQSSSADQSEQDLSQATLAAALSDRPDDTLMKMIEILVEADFIEEAIQTAESITGTFQRAESLNRIAGRLAQLGQREQGLALLNEIATTLEETGAAAGDHTSVVTLLTQVATHYASLGRKSTAFEILDKLIGIAQTGPPSSRQDVLLSAIAKQYAQIGGLSKAYVLIEEIGQPEIRMHALVHLLIEADHPDVSPDTQDYLLSQIVAKHARL